MGISYHFYCRVLKYRHFNRSAGCRPPKKSSWLSATAFEQFALREAVAERVQRNVAERGMGERGKLVCSR